MIATRQNDRRRHPRSDVSWLVVVEVGKRRFLLQTVDISARGAKVRPKERLDIAIGDRSAISAPCERG